MTATGEVYQLPDDLRTQAQWVCWREEVRDGDMTKVPYAVTGGRASTTNPKTWAPLNAALIHAEEHGFSGVGFVFTEDDPFAGIDLDKCRDSETGEVEPWAQKIVTALDSYTEISPSGTGLHIFVKATLPGQNNRKGLIEMYESRRYFTLTGNHLDGTPTEIHERQDALERLYSQIFKATDKPTSVANGHKARQLDFGDEKLLALATQAKNGDKFSRLWRGDTSDHGGDHSKADAALCSHLGFWTHGDTERMDRLFRQSGLYREKWNRHDYRERTFRKALEGKTEFYQPGEAVSINLNGAGSVTKPNGKAPTPTHDELRDCWIGDNPHYAHGLGEWRRYGAGTWPTVSETSVKAEIAEVIEKAKPEGVKPTASILASVTELTRIKVYVPDESWDADPDVLVCQNGALRISTGELMNHRPEHYATSATPYEYNPDAVPAYFRLFLQKTLPSAGPFLQEFAGYALTTNMSHELAVWLFGPPGSGKSTLLAGFQAMLGHRAGILGLAELERSRFTLADLPGKTLVVASEQPSSYLASTNTLNAIISGEPLQVERKYRDPFTVIPRAKVCWAMNELPRVADANSGLFRRVKVVAFPELPEEDRDPEVKRRIEQEGAGILNWALEGLHRLTERGYFDIPEGIQDATRQFRTNNDVPALFVEDRCIKGSNFEVQASHLYREYKFWCEDNGHRPQSSTRLADDWRRLGFERKRTMAGTVYRGLQLDS